MKENIFRKKSIDRMKAPDELKDYIRISGTGIWILVLSLAVLLIGALIWGKELLIF